MRRFSTSALLQRITVQPGPRRGAPAERVATPLSAGDRGIEQATARASDADATQLPVSDQAIVRLLL